MERQFELEYARDIVIERANRTKIILEDSSIMNPRPIHAKLLNWEDKEFLLKIGPSRLKRNNNGFGVKIYVSDNVTKKVREDRKVLRTRHLPDIRQKPGVKKLHLYHSKSRHEFNIKKAILGSSSTYRTHDVSDCRIFNSCLTIFTNELVCPGLFVVLYQSNLSLVYQSFRKSVPMAVLLEFCYGKL